MVLVRVRRLDDGTLKQLSFRYQVPVVSSDDA
jgi:hypothetical protein